MKIEEAILKILQKEPNLKAKEIVIKLKSLYKIESDKTTLNKLLYGTLKVKLSVDNQFRWKINNIVDQPISVPKIPNNLLSTLSAYYLDCLSKDLEAGVSCYASNKYGSPDYGQISQLPGFETRQIKDDLNSPDVKNTIEKVKRDKNRLILQLGYPINHRKITTKEYSFNVVEPLFLIPIEMEPILSFSKIKVKNEFPSINVIALKNLSGLEKNELFQEILFLNEELGLNNTFENLPDFDELVLKLKEIRPNWNWLDELDVENLKTTLLKEQLSSGIHNSAALFLTERSKYTIGLEKELQDFQKIDADHLKNSSLEYWLSGNFPKFEFKEFAILEPIPLNDEQKEAVNLALQSPLTVITGPPGTGKSQVVTNLIINAIYNGQTVLFSSKNHKAVDVVYERINGLASRQIMLRLGNTDMQSEFANYLSNLLSENIVSSDLKNLEIYQKQRDELIRKTKDLKDKDNYLISLINETSELENKIDENKKIYDELFLEKVLTDLDFLRIQDVIDKLNHGLSKIDKKNLTFIERFFWVIIKKSKFKGLDKLWRYHIDIFNSMNIQLPIEILSANNISEFLNCLNQLNEILNLGKAIDKLKKNIELLKTLNSFTITEDYNEIDEKVAENSISVWESWLKILPYRLTEENRKTIGEFITLLNLLIKATSENSNADKKTFARYYNILPKISNILPCWAVTSLSVRGKVPFEPGFFDLVIIDEASQCDISSALPLLYRAKRAVIIGDNKQLSHISLVSKNQDFQLLEQYKLDSNHLIWSYVGNSLFGLAQSICEKSHIITLKDHHRSHSDIINFSNKEFYGGKLRIATRYNNLKSIKNEPSVRWENIEGLVTSPKTGGAYNEPEAIAIIKELKRVINSGYSGTIGVVSPFRAQANLINELINRDIQLRESLMAHNFMADTVHRFQGDERDLIIFSTVISKNLPNGAKSFLAKTGNLFNVAITRARAILLIIGDFNSCSVSGVSYMESFTEYVSNLKQQNEVKNLDIENLGPIYPVFEWKVIVSDWEKLFYEELYKSGIKTIPQFKIEQYSLDLALIIGNRKLDIEIDGEKYHKNWDGELLVRDKIRNKRLIELGWDVKRFWVYEVKNDMKGCIDELKKWINIV